MLTINKNAFGKVAVLMGGDSVEREVSLMSGEEVSAALGESGVNVETIDVHRVDEHLMNQLINGHFNRVFNILHGGAGEDGRLQALLEAIGLPYTGSGVAASALAMDKLRCKWIWKTLNLPVGDFIVLNSQTNWDDVVNQLGAPMFVKPSNGGSSLGVYKVWNKNELIDAFYTAAKYDEVVIAERFLAGGEYTVSVVGDRILPSIKIEPNREFYDYEAKYFLDDTKYLCPSGLSEAEENHIKMISLKAYQAIGCRHWGRVDLMRDEQGHFYILEINTSPGMTTHSLVPKAAARLGIDFSDLVLEILAQTLEPNR